jgi:hypothetical protein
MPATKSRRKPSAPSSTTEASKPYKGEIIDLRKVWVKKDNESEYRKDIFGPNLGYIFYCTFLNHPTYGFSPGGRTSLVVSYDEKTGDLETLNSRYKVV